MHFKTRRTAVLLSALLALQTAGTALAQTQASTASDPQNQTLTLYSSRFAVVQETRTVDLRQGQNEIQLGGVSGQYTPQTLMVVSVDGQGQFTLGSVSYQQANLNSSALLESAVGKEIKVTYNDGGQGVTVTGKLIAVSDNELIVLPDYQPQNPTIIRDRTQVTLPELPAELSNTPSLTMQADATKSGAYAIRILYQSSGFAWSATHSAVFDEKTSSLTSFDTSVSITNNSGTAYKDVNINLLSGSVSGAQPQAVYGLQAAGAPAPGSAARSFDAAVESTGEQKLYVLPGKVSINQGENKQIPLLSAHNVPVQEEYYFTVNGYAQDAKTPVSVRLHTQNDAAHNLGKPLPQGGVRIYQTDKRGNLQLTGATSIRDVAVGETFLIELGTSTDVKYSVKVVSESVDPKPADPQSTQPQYQTTVYQVTIYNSKDKSVSVNLNQPLGSSDSSITQATHKFTQDDANTACASVSVPAQGQTVVTYTLKVKVN